MRTIQFLKWPIEGDIHVTKPLLHPWHRLPQKMIAQNKASIIVSSSSSVKRNQSQQRRYLLTLDQTLFKLKTRTWAPRTTFSHPFPSHVHHSGMKTRKTTFSPSPWWKTTSWVAFLQHLYLRQHLNPTTSQCHHAIWTALE